MLKTTTLLDAVQNLDSLDEEYTIYAARPWAVNSVAIIAPEPESGGLPPEAEGLQLSYFLEVFIAREFLEDWIAGKHSIPSLEEQCSRLIKYAEKDA